MRFNVRRFGKGVFFVGCYQNVNEVSFVDYRKIEIDEEKRTLVLECVCVYYCLFSW